MLVLGNVGMLILCRVVGAQEVRGGTAEGEWGQGHISPGGAERFGICCGEDGDPLKDFKQVICILKFLLWHGESMTVN